MPLLFEPADEHVPSHHAFDLPLAWAIQCRTADSPDAEWGPVVGALKMPAAFAQAQLMLALANRHIEGEGSAENREYRLCVVIHRDHPDEMWGGAILAGIWPIDHVIERPQGFGTEIGFLAECTTAPEMEEECPAGTTLIYWDAEWLEESAREMIQGFCNITTTNHP